MSTALKTVDDVKTDIEYYLARLPFEVSTKAECERAQILLTETKKEIKAREAWFDEHIVIY